MISAHKAGAVVVAIDAQAEGPLDSFVGSENYDAGFQAGEYLAKALGGKGKVAILTASRWCRSWSACAALKRR